MSFSPALLIYHGTFISLTCKNLTSDNVKSFINVKMHVRSSTSFHPRNTITGERWVDMTRFVLRKKKIYAGSYLLGAYKQSLYFSGT